MAIFDHPLKPVCGVTANGRGNIVFYMYETYDRLPFEAEAIAAELIDTLPEGMLTLIRGDLNNPLFQWPVFAKRIGSKNHGSADTENPPR
jgi:hypothetical protein